MTAMCLVTVNADLDEWVLQVSDGTDEWLDEIYSKGDG